MKKKWVKYTLIIVVVVTAIVGGKVFMDQQAEKEMIRIVHSDEAKRIYEGAIKHRDDRALEKDGIIKSYKIDENSIELNPMGGVMVDLIINDNPKLVIGLILSKDGNKSLYNGSSTTTKELLDLLAKENKDHE